MQLLYHIRDNSDTFELYHSSTPPLSLDFMREEEFFYLTSGTKGLIVEKKEYGAYHLQTTKPKKTQPLRKLIHKNNSTSNRIVPEDDSTPNKSTVQHLNPRKLIPWTT